MRRYNKYKKMIRLFAGICLLTILFNSCSRDDVKIVPQTKLEEVTLKFFAKPPIKSSNSVKTYALEEEDEEKIESIDILVFADDGNGNMNFNHRTKARIVDLPNIEAKLWKTETNSKLVILANVRQQLDEYFFSDEETLEQIQSKLKYELEGEWPARLDIDEEEFVPFPMWAEYDLHNPIDEDIDLTDEEVSLLRSVARVDVQVTGTAENLFNLQGIYVFNNNENGLIIPDPGNLLSALPSLPMPLATNSTLFSRLEYETSGENSVGQIYLFETEAASVPEDASTLVIRGTFDSSIDPDEGMHFYRIDFQDENGDRIPLLRNHQYVVNIVNAEFDIDDDDRPANEIEAFSLSPPLSHPEASHFGSTGIMTGQSNLNQGIPTRRKKVSVKSTSGLQYTITTVNEQE